MLKFEPPYVGSYSQQNFPNTLSDLVKCPRSLVTEEFPQSPLLLWRRGSRERRPFLLNSPVTQRDLFHHSNIPSLQNAPALVALTCTRLHQVAPILDPQTLQI